MWNAAVSVQVLCTPFNHAPVYICRVYVCLAVTCYLHFWQNDRDILPAPAVTQGFNEYRNKSPHRKLTLEKKIIPPLLLWLKPRTFRSRVRCSKHWAIPAPQITTTITCYLYSQLSAHKVLIPWWSHSEKVYRLLLCSNTCLCCCSAFMLWAKSFWVF